MDNTRTADQTHGNTVIAQPQAPEVTCSVRLSERDEAEVMAVAEKPPAPNGAALQAARRFLERHG